MTRNRKLISPVSLREVYAERGKYEAKMIIDPDDSPGIDDVDVDVRNSDGLPMKFTAKRWGTKLTINFTIDEETPDGVSIIDVYMRGKIRGGQPVRERFDFWVVKD